MINIANLNYFDYFCLFIVSSSIIFAFFKGFVSTTLSLIRFILTLLITFNFSHLLVPITSKFISHHAIAEYVAFIALFLVVLVSLSIIKHFIIQSLSFFGKGYVDRMLGGLFGLIRGVSIVSVIFFVIICFTGAVNIDNNHKFTRFTYNKSNAPQWINKAQLNDQLLHYSKIIVAILPENLWKKITDVLINKAEEKQLSNFDPEDISTKLLMLKKIHKLLSNNAHAKTALEILNQLEHASKDQQKILLEKFLVKYNEEIIKEISFDDHKKILEIIDKFQVEPTQFQ